MVYVIRYGKTQFLAIPSNVSLRQNVTRTFLHTCTRSLPE